jgi:two-component system, sensor histidine kinase and response regulator
MLGQWHIEAASIDTPAAAAEVMRWACRVGRPFSFGLIDSAAAAENDGRLLDEIANDSALAAIPLVLIGDIEPDLAAGIRTKRLNLCETLGRPVSQSSLLQAITGVASQAGTAGSLAALSGRLSAGSPETAGEICSSVRRILVAEDNPANQELIRAMLESLLHSATVLIVNDAQEALDALAEQRFDLFLTDIQMPRMSGVEASAELRRRESGSADHTPVIAVTAHAMKGDREIYLASGMDGYVSKPIDRNALFREIERVMDTVLTAA